MKTIAKKGCGGFTLVEVMMSLVILATLMTAVAFAFDAAVTNYQANRGIYQTVNTARQVLLRITTDLRTANIVALEVDDSPNQNSQISLFDRNDNNIRYRFDSTDNKLYYDDIDNSNSYVLCEHVTVGTFNRTEHEIERNGIPEPAVRDVRIVLTVTDETGDISQTLAAATLVRKNQ